jgi:hypothetical protein
MTEGRGDLQTLILAFFHKLLLLLDSAMKSGRLTNPGLLELAGKCSVGRHAALKSG